MTDEQDFEDIEFSREEARRILGSAYKTISEKRWNRIREEVNFQDLVIEMTGRKPKGDAISCPFHGRDSTPSFHLYRGSNDAYCFGCAPGDQYWDSVKLVSRLLSMTRPSALKWLEDRYSLPKMEDEVEEVEEEHIILLEFDDVKESYLRRAQELLKKCETQKVDLVRELTKIYFVAEKAKDPLPLSKVIGLAQVRKILKDKQRRIEIGELSV